MVVWRWVLVSVVRVVVAGVFQHQSTMRCQRTSVRQTRPCFPSRPSSKQPRHAVLCGVCECVFGVGWCHGVLLGVFVCVACPCDC